MSPFTLTPKRKRHLTYVTISIFFLLGGIEYAVILPTLWLYLQNRFNVPPYYLGFVISAFSLADLLSGPILGRWSDRTHNTKLVLLVANIPQIIGSLMYFSGNEHSVWLLVGGRFIAGLGSGVGAALFADVARVTSTADRTGVLAMFMAVRQFGLLFGPACNLFLRHLNFKIAGYGVDKYTSPGLFMAVLWLLHELLVLLMFWNLPALHLEEQLEIQENNSSQYQQLPSTSETQQPVAPDIGDSSVFSSECVVIVPAASYLPESPSAIFPSPIVRRTASGSSANQRHVTSSSDLTISNEMIEEAEEFMNGGSDAMEASVDRSTYGYQSLSWPCDASSPILRQTSDSFLQRRHRHTYGAVGQTIATDSENYDGSRVTAERRSTSDPIVGGESTTQETASDVIPIVPPNSLEVTLSWRYYVNEFVREEVVALIATVFVAFFNQAALETMLIPLTKELLSWGELENSFLFCGAGVEVIVVFIAIRYASRFVSDRMIILFGLLIESVTIAFLTWFIPQAQKDDPKNNLPPMLIAVFLDLLGLPLVNVASNGLFTKITRKETQGFAQGIRRIFVGLGLILAPLWAGSMLSNPYGMFGVMLAVNLLLTIPLILSFRKLKPSCPSPSIDINVSTAGTGDGEARPVL